MKQKKIEIQTRDKKILQFVFEFRVVTYGQIRQKFFPTQHPSASRNRIYSLCKAGYLKSLSVEKNGFQVKCVVPLEQCWESIKLSWGFSVTKPLYKSESIEHDFRLVDLALRLEKLKLFDGYLSENLLQSSPDLASEDFYREAALLHPDGILKLKHKDGTILVYAVEYEISRKASERYRKKIESYYKVSGIDGVLYVCGNKGIQDLVARVDKEICKESRSSLYLASEVDVLSSDKTIKFQSSDGRIIGLY